MEFCKKLNKIERDINMKKKEILEKTKMILKHIFIDGLTGMTWGLFATLIIGLIIIQIGKLIPGEIGRLMILIGTISKSITGAGIGIGVAVKFKSSPFVTASAAVAGLVGAFATQVLAGTIVNRNKSYYNRTRGTIWCFYISNGCNRNR